MKQNLLKSFLSTILIAFYFFAYSQTGGVSINKTNTAADASAMLDVSSTTAPYMGMLIPRMSTANRNTIVSPATGLQIFNTDCGLNEYYTGTCWISMGQNLKAPDPITCLGTTDFCANETRTFTIPAVNGATGYQWTEPSGATITSGQGTTSVMIVFGNNSGEVCVTAGSLCETSPSRCKSIHINPVPLVPGNITGPTTSAPGTTASYFIAAVAGASLYNWTVPSGTTITSGVGTTMITASFSCSAVSGSVSVTAQNNCGASAASSLAITLTPPVLADAGAAIIAPGTIGGSPTASGGTSPYTYAWLPSTGLSSTTTANPTTTVCPLTTYTVTVTDAKGCTASSSTTASNLNSSEPAAPGSIAGNTSVCANSSGEVYSISAVATATSYTWTVPSGASITAGQNTTSITVTFGSSTGNVSVTATNSCGIGSASTYAVTVNACTQTFNATGSGSTGTIQTFTVPSGVTSLTIDAYGAQGGSTGQSGGLGARIKGTVSVTPGQQLNILVGQVGVNPSQVGGGGGGGGSFVTDNSNNPLIVAGGGGGAGAGNAGGPGVATTTAGSSTGGNSTAGGSANAAGAGNTGGYSGGSGGGGTCCNGVQSNSDGGLGSGGGAGFTGNGGPGQNGQIISYSFINGGAGGYHSVNYGTPTNSYGGFGGGGGGVNYSYQAGGGGGGGYSGGGGGTGITSGGGGGGGGGSYNNGTNQTNTAGVQSGNGQVIISW